MNEMQLRKEAVRRVMQGESVADVCDDLGRTRTWCYKWLKRFQAAGVSGLTDQRGGKTPSNATPDWLRALIIETRDRLVEQARTGDSFQGIGAREVVRELEQLEIEVPHWTTIHRVLKEAGRITDVTQPTSYCPRPVVDGPNSVHQIDIWPRVLQGGERLNFFHLVDVACWYPHGKVTNDKTTDTALDFLVECWQTVGLPRIAQFDNEMTFTGGRWAHRLGRVVRLCLILGIQVWFIPFYTPERNGFAERFHGECDQFFWSRKRFETTAQVEAAYPDFLSYFRNQRRLPAIQDHTPVEMRTCRPDLQVQLLSTDFALHRRKSLPIATGIIHCVRLANCQGQVNILNHQISLEATYAKHYVLAHIDTGDQQMTLYHQPHSEAELDNIGSYPFPLKKPVCDFDPAFEYQVSGG